MTDSSTMWVVVGGASGAIIGVAGSLLTTWLNARLSRDETVSAYDKAASNILKHMLQTGDEWQSATELSNVIGCSVSDTKEYLILIGARGSPKNGDQWALLSRNQLSSAPSN